jgi:Tat protein secretion system quality control protein TatD with DNase activity
MLQVSSLFSHGHRWSHFLLHIPICLLLKLFCPPEHAACSSIGELGFESQPQHYTHKKEVFRKMHLKLAFQLRLVQELLPRVTRAGGFAEM